MGASCINAADVDDTLETDQSSISDMDIPISELEEVPAEMYIDNETMLCGFYGISVNNSCHEVEDSVSNTSVSLNIDSIGSFNTTPFITYDTKLKDGQCLNHSCPNYAEENTLSDNQIANISNDFIGNLKNSHNFFKDSENVIFLNCIQNRSMTTMPRNSDEEEENFRNCLTLNSNQTLDETCKYALIGLREYNISADIGHKSADDDSESYDLSLNIECDCGHIDSCCPDYLNSDFYGLEINNSYSDETGISEDNIEYYELANNSIVIGTPDISVDKMLVSNALTFNTNILNNWSANDQSNKITITDTVICNNCIFTKDFNQNGESIFNQRLQILNKSIIEDKYEELIEELTPLNPTIEFFDCDLILSQYHLTNFCENKAYEIAEHHTEANGENKSLESRYFYLASESNAVSYAVSAEIRNLSHLKGNGNTTAANDATIWGKTIAEALKRLWDYRENRFCLDIQSMNPLKKMINDMGILNQGDETRVTDSTIGVKK